MSAHKPKESSTDILEAFWRRRTFHDMSVESIAAVNRRVLVRLEEFTLIITNVSRLTQSAEFPTSWIDHRWTVRDDEFVLHVELELGEFEVAGRDLRLIRNRDLAVLIPAIDT